MTLLEQTYRTLKEAGLVNSAEAFSRDYLGKCKGWYAFQKHTGRDFSISAAIHCLRSLRQSTSRIHHPVAEKAAVELAAYLSTAHHVAEIY